MSLCAAIHQVRAQNLAVVKTGKISGGINAAFASYADVWSTLHPALAAAGITTGWSGATIRMVGETEIVSMTMEISDGTTVKEAPFEMIVPEKILNARGSSVTNNAQRVANAESYCKRTALIHFFGMSAGNEDEVERMMPHGDQTNIPGLIMVNDATRWQDLTDGVWSDAMSPLEDGKLESHAKQGEEHMRELWKSYPHHAGLCAWGADWITARLEAAGMAWADVVEREATLPMVRTNCTYKQLRMACAVLIGTLKPKES